MFTAALVDTSDLIPVQARQERTDTVKVEVVNQGEELGVLAPHLQLQSDAILPSILLVDGQHTRLVHHTMTAILQGFDDSGVWIPARMFAAGVSRSVGGSHFSPKGMTLIVEYLAVDQFPQLGTQF